MNTEQINELLAATLGEWGVPGGSLAIIQGDQAFARGYGLQAAGQPAPVDADTRFAIGSTTKAFTSAAVGMLVDAGTLGWDDPVLRFLPDFALADPWVTEQVTVRDLLCHRLGLERAQRLYYHQGYTQRDLMRRMRHLRPLAGFRSQFHYANQQFGVAGLLIEAASGQSWDDLVAERIFRPLGMHRSATGFDRLGGSDNLATPHAVLDEAYPAGVRFLGEARPIPWYPLSQEPAGSIITTANDLLGWLRMLVQGGAPLLQPATFAEIGTPQMVMQDVGNSELAPLFFLQPGTHFWTYGLGWWVLDYRGERVLMHGGQMPGFNSVIACYPDRQLAFAVTVNVHQTLAHAALFYALSDLLLAGPGRPWSAEFMQVAQGYMAQVRAEEDRMRSARRADLRPTLAPERLLGAYAHALYGEAVVGMAGDGLTLTYGASRARLEHWEGDTYLGVWDLKGLLDDVLVRFEPGLMTLINDQATYTQAGAMGMGAGPALSGSRGPVAFDRVGLGEG